MFHVEQVGEVICKNNLKKMFHVKQKNYSDDIRYLGI